MRKEGKKREEEVLWSGKERGGSWQCQAEGRHSFGAGQPHMRDTHYRKYLTSPRVLGFKSWSDIRAGKLKAQIVSFITSQTHLKR